MTDRHTIEKVRDEILDFIAVLVFLALDAAEKDVRRVDILVLDRGNLVLELVERVCDLLHLKHCKRWCTQEKNKTRSETDLRHFEVHHVIGTNDELVLELGDDALVFRLLKLAHLALLERLHKQTNKTLSDPT